MIDTDFNSAYLKRNKFSEQAVITAPKENLKLIVVIPCFNEESLIPTLTSLSKTHPVEGVDIEVIVSINSGEHHDQSIKSCNQKCGLEAENWHVTEKPHFQLHVLYHLDLPQKHAGVGLGRKIGMDEACRRFRWVNQQEVGVIICFDADSLCEENYFHAIWSHFKNHPQSPACSIHYEHPIDDETHLASQAIIDYELHLRYYVNALQFAGHPHAYQTIGSSMAVKASDYEKEGGMNRRKAGEDFYFLHKFIPSGKFTECVTTTVIPSPRVSDRVPFGTGKAVGDYLITQNTNRGLTYQFNSFLDLKEWLDRVPNWFDQTLSSIELEIHSFPEPVSRFLTTENHSSELSEIKRQSTNINTFINRYFRWFNGFMAMKYAHFCRDHFYPNQPIRQEAEKLLRTNQIPFTPTTSLSLLHSYRSWDKQKAHKKASLHKQ